MTSYLNLILCLISMTGIWYLFFFARPKYHEDAYRQKLFVLRDKLFSEAEAGKISFDDPVYIELRSVINSSIRFAHRLDIYYLRTLSQELSKRPDLQKILDERAAQSALNTTDTEKKAFIEQYRTVLSDTTVKYLAARSPIFTFSLVFKNMVKRLFRSLSAAVLTNPWTGTITALTKSANTLLLMIPQLDQMEQNLHKAKHNEDGNKLHLTA